MQIFKYERFSIDALDTFGLQRFKEVDALRDCKKEKWSNDNFRRARYAGLISLGGYAGVFKGGAGNSASPLAILSMCYITGLKPPESWNHVYAKFLLSTEITKIFENNHRWSYKDITYITSNYGYNRNEELQAQLRNIVDLIYEQETV